MSFHDVADGDHAAEFALRENREVANSVLGHQPHDRFNFILEIACNHIPRHNLIDGLILQMAVSVGTGTEDIAFGDDPDHRFALNDHQRAAIAFDKRGDDISQGCRRGDRMDLGSLCFEDGMYIHG